MLNNPYKDVTDRVNAIVERLGLPQTEVGKIARVHRSTVSRWINGKAYPDLVQMELLERAGEQHQDTESSGIPD